MASDDENKKVVFGSTILVEDDDGEEHSFRLVEQTIDVSKGGYLINTSGKGSAWSRSR